MSNAIDLCAGAENFFFSKFSWQLGQRRQNVFSRPLLCSSGFNTRRPATDFEKYLIYCTGRLRKNLNRNGTIIIIMGAPIHMWPTNDDTMWTREQTWNISYRQTWFFSGEGCKVWAAICVFLPLSCSPPPPLFLSSLSPPSSSTNPNGVTLHSRFHYQITTF